MASDAQGNFPVFLELGWRILSSEPVAKTLVESENLRIVEFRSGERGMILAFPLLSEAEAKLLWTMQKRFQQSADSTAATADKTALKVFFRRFCTEQSIETEPEQEDYLLLALEKTVFGFWPLDDLLACDTIEEISVVGIGARHPVRVYEGTFGWLSVNVCIEQAVFFRHLVNRMARAVGKRLSLKTPRLNAVLTDGSRLHAAIEPVAFGGVTLCVRKFREKPFTPLDLIVLKTLDASIAAFLWMALQTDCSVVVCGNTGSGKTSTLNALFCFIPKEERVVSIEETPELRLMHAHWVRLSTFEESGVRMDSLILDSLRMRPDRVVVGEMRSAEEVAAFVDTLLAGQGKGSLATFHAQSAREALGRFRSLGVFEMDLAAIDLLIVQKRLSRVDAVSGQRFEERCIVEVCEVVENGKTVECRPLFGFDFEENCWKQTGKSVRLAQKICRTFGLDRAGFETEWDRRRSFLEREAFSGRSYAELFSCLESELGRFQKA
ncbi:MAG: ATPase, T2SS/T4P/T4SS family [Candidatus Diapherotrites archaeon]|nr:ATPase, T2SS/T4P/T4SS family [Candidatus Diapherotrites archaeon]